MRDRSSIEYRSAAARAVDAMPCCGESAPISHDADRLQRTIGVLRGEGIGSEVVAAAEIVLAAVAAREGITFQFRYGGLIGNEAQVRHGAALTPKVKAFCRAIFDDGGAILCGPGGGRFVYDLRSAFDLYCKLTPIGPIPALADTGALRPDACADVDIIVIRENCGGIYFGKGLRGVRGDGCRTASHTFHYDENSVRRILEVAIRVAHQRSRKLTIVLKPDGVPAVCELWTELIEEMMAEAMNEAIDWQILEVDNACYQIISAASAFDVVVAPNMLGDIVSDVASLLLGSRGMSFSANFGLRGEAVYQTGHGAARDLAGTDAANPIGQILSAAMMLRGSLAMPSAANSIESAVQQVLAQGVRTPDIAAIGSTVVGTREMARLIAEALTNEVRSQPVKS